MGGLRKVIIQNTFICLIFFLRSRTIPQTVHRVTSIYDHRREKRRGLSLLANALHEKKARL